MKIDDKYCHPEYFHDWRLLLDRISSSFRASQLEITVNGLSSTCSFKKQPRDLVCCPKILDIENEIDVSMLHLYLNVCRRSIGLLVCTFRQSWNDIKYFDCSHISTSLFSEYYIQVWIILCCSATKSKNHCKYIQCVFKVLPGAFFCCMFWRVPSNSIRSDLPVCTGCKHPWHLQRRLIIQITLQQSCQAKVWIDKYGETRIQGRITTQQSSQVKVWIDKCGEIRILLKN